MWKIGAVKREGRRTLRSNYFVCFIACLALVFVVNGPMSVSETVNLNVSVLKGVAEWTRGTPVADALDKLVDGAERFKRATSLGMDAKKGTYGDAYRKLAASRGIHGLIVNAVNKNLADGRLDPNAVFLLGLIFALLIYLFIGGVLEVGLARVYLEARSGPDARLSRLFFVYGVGRTRRVALFILLRTVYLILWAFTVVGFPVKYYSYRLAPYIVAEDHEIAPREALALSSRLMRGYKMRTFLFDLSFLPLWLLSIVTFGIVQYVWLGPYYYASRAELYAAIRGGERTPRACEYSRLPAKFAGMLSLIGAKPRYSYLNLAFMFLIFSFIGWVFECTLFIVEDGVFINRGTMYGPWIPIYGVGGVVIIMIVNRFYRKPIACFFMIIAVCAPIEYIGAWMLWEMRHLKYWDYSGYFLNIQGRICLENMINFAVMGMMGIYIIAPVVDSVLSRVPLRTRKAICTALYTAFLFDTVCANVWPRSGRGITDELS